MKQSVAKRAWAALPLALVLGLALVMADGGGNHQTAQTGPIQLGTSGGNVNDRSNAFCCSGTLGALVTYAGKTHILSNNHVVGLSGSATVGDDISHPGLIDVGCNVNATRRVADFYEAPALGTKNVDAGVAEVVSGEVDLSGAILDFNGPPSSTPGAAANNMTVAKSGRTTGFTCGPVTSTSTDVSVQYQDGCGKGKKFVVTYTNQVVIGSSSFSAGGDSGSLIVQASTARPVALLYAGSSSTTIGNPIADVVAAFPGMTFVGGGDRALTCPGGGGGGGGGGNPGKGKGGSGIGRDNRYRNTPEMARIAKEQNAARLMLDEAIMGVGVGETADGEGIVVIYVEEGRAHGFIPAMLNGIRTEIVRTDRFRAYGWNEKLMPAGACKSAR